MLTRVHFLVLSVVFTYCVDFFVFSRVFLVF